MVKKLSGLLFLGFLFLSISPKKVVASGYVIESFEVKMEVEKDTDLFVKEKIEVDFSSPRHGIYRYLPLYHTSSGVTIKTPVRVISVTDEDESLYRYEVSNTGGNVQIKIGNPEKFVEGRKTYLVTYRVSNVLRSYGDGYELYWNVVGSGWDTQIRKASILIDSPYADIKEAACYAGNVRTKESLCQLDVTPKALFSQSGVPLGLSKDMTVVVSFDEEGELIYPAFVIRAWWFIAANLSYLFAVLPFIFIYYFWQQRGRDKRYVGDNIYYKPENVATKSVSLFARKHLPLVYHPIDGLTPAEVGTIIDERVQTHDVIAEVVELARLGFLKIEKIDKKEYAFIKEKEINSKNTQGLKGYQKKILDELFRQKNKTKSMSTLNELVEDKKVKEKVAKRLIRSEYVLLSSLKNEFYKVLSDVKKDLYERMKDEGFFADNPETTRIKWLVVYGLLVAGVGTLVLWFVTTTVNPIPLMLFVTLSVIGGVLAWFMPRRTPKGYSLFRQTQGLKEYLKKGKWRYEHMEKNLFFEEILPLAISLQVVDQLTKDMDEMGVKPPEYFGGATVSSFNLYLSDFYTNSAKGLVSTPASSSSSWSGGSGFSGGSVGGGFGGGGGGSW